jgi:hypothetical protein
MGGYSQCFSRRTFVAGTSSFAALHSMANLLPLPPLIAALQNDSRLSQTVVADKGFAAVRRVGNGLYATSQVPVKAADRLRPLRRRRYGRDVCASVFAYRYTGQKRIER